MEAETAADASQSGGEAALHGVAQRLASSRRCGACMEAETASYASQRAGGEAAVHGVAQRLGGHLMRLWRQPLQCGQLVGLGGGSSWDLGSSSWRQLLGLWRQLLGL